jgi:D-alanyl-D-alanine dipeptidase
MSNKVTNRNYILIITFLIFSTSSFLTISAQDSSFSRPPVTDSWNTYKKQVRADPARKMVELKSVIPGIIYDLRYATTNNFMHRLMYPAKTKSTFLRSPVAEGLRKVQQELQAKGFGLKIFDAYRPYSVTVKFWELVKDERYVANPSKGSGHNRGIAVDLTIVRLGSGEELNMGTGFDNFTDTAHHAFTALPEEVLKNRNLLRSTMEKYGLKLFDTEWWHYYWADGSHFEILDLDFKKLRKSVN